MHNFYQFSITHMGSLQDRVLGGIVGLLFGGNLHYCWHWQHMSIDSGSNYVCVHLVYKNNGYIRACQKVFETGFNLCCCGIYRFTRINSKQGWDYRKIYSPLSTTMKLASRSSLTSPIPPSRKPTQVSLKNHNVYWIYGFFLLNTHLISNYSHKFSKNFRIHRHFIVTHGWKILYRYPK